MSIGKGIYRGFDCVGKKHEQFIPQKHQLETMNFFMKSPYKGLLLYHKLGSGKTCTAIMIADKMLRKEKVKTIYILTPGSLREGWINEYCKVCGFNIEYLKEKYIFVTYNYAIGKKLPDFNDSLVIIDEIHNLINGVKNKSFNPTQIYDALLKANCRILALSGTVIYNFVYEFALLGNLLKPGGEFPEIRRGKNLDTNAFLKWFESDSKGVLIPKNPSTMRRRLDGIISYYPGAGIEFVPEVIHQDPIKTKMTSEQEENYWARQNQEEKLSRPPSEKLITTNKDLYDLLSRLYIMAKKNILTRLASNFFYKNVDSQQEAIIEIGIAEKIDINAPKIIQEKPENIQVENILEEEIADVKEGEETKLSIDRKVKRDVTVKDGGWVSKEHFSNGQLYKIYSTKFTALLINIIMHDKQKHVLFTFFKEKAGVNLIKSLLSLCGIKSAIFSGDLNDQERRRVLKKFNSPENRYGDVIRVLLVTEAGAEGISVLEARHMHILESSPRMSKTIQAIGRVARFKSHIKLPPEERTIKVWKYWSTASEEPVTITTTFLTPDGKTEKVTKTITDKRCIDELLYDKGMKTVREVDSFLELLQEVSVTSTI
jgi:superfamily II DNA or RNA helicase